MIREYAIDPEVITGWDRLRLLAMQAGVPLGRLIVEFPRRWQALVYQHVKGLNLDDSQLKKIGEKLASSEMARKLSSRDGAKFNPQKPWIENALAEQARRPFDAIVAQSSAITNPCILAFDDVDDSHPLWAAKRGGTVKRTASQIALLVRPLLRMSKRIVLADPFFHPHKGRHVRPLREIVSKISWAAEAIEYHFTEKPGGRFSYELSFLWRECDRLLGSFLPARMPLKLVMWPEDHFHNRFALTDLGGIQFGHGLDEATPGKAQEDDVNLLDQEHFDEKWASFEITESQMPKATHTVRRSGGANMPVGGRQRV